MVVLWLTGIVNSKLRGMPEGPLWWTKLGLFLVLIALQVALTRRVSPAAVRINFALTRHHDSRVRLGHPVRQP